MASFSRHPHKIFGWAILIAAMFALFAPDAAYAQRPAGGRGRRPQRPKDRPPRPVQPRDEDQAPAPGAEEGYILRYKEADEEDKKDAPDLLGVLKIKPYGKKTDLLILQVHRSDDFKVRLGDREIEYDEFGKFFRKRLHVSVNWDFLNPDSKREDKYKEKILRSLSFKTTEVIGEVDEILEGGRLVVYGVPANDAQWPDYVPDQKMNMSEKPKVRRKKLKLLVIDDVTKFFTEDESDADISDFKVEDKVQVTVIYAATKPGYVLKVRPPGVTQEQSKDDDDDRGTPPPPRGGRPRKPGRAPQG